MAGMWAIRVGLSNACVTGGTASIQILMTSSFDPR